MDRLDGRVVIVTGAGRGLGREHAKFLAAHGARVVVNDLGADVHGEGADSSPAQQVVEEIRSGGGEAVVSGHDVADWQQAGELVRTTVETFGTLHGLVNNAGILRDRTIVNMTEPEWDAVVRVHLKGHAAPTHHAMQYWREQAKQGTPVDRPALVHTSSASGFIGNFGQANYGAAKSGVLGLMHVARLEGAAYGLRSNAVGPAATTRMSEDPSDGDAESSARFLDPAFVSPVVAWLVSAGCPANGQLLHVYGNRVVVMAVAAVAADLRHPGGWTMDALDQLVGPELVTPLLVEDFLPQEGEDFR